MIQSTDKTVYRSRIDWWLWLVWGLCVAFTIYLGIDCHRVLIFSLFAIFISALFVFCLFGIYYAIDGDNLIVYQFWRPYPMPISKIKSVKYTTGFLATAGASTRRVSIAFTDRSVMKSYAPLEISPKDRDGFTAQLQRINPEIKVIR